MKDLTPIVKPIKLLPFIDINPKPMGKKKKKILNPLEEVRP